MADELLNLVEYAKGHADPFTSALVEQFAMQSDILQTIGFKTATQGINPFARETSLPTVAFRAINSEPEISHGTQEQLQDQCYPISGLLEFDRVLLNRYGEAKRNTYLRGQMKKGSAVWTDTFINGDNDTTPTEFDGIAARLLATNAGAAAADVNGSNDDSRLIANSTASGGAALSLAKLDLAINLVNEPTHLIMSRRMKNKFIAAERNTSVSGYVIHTENENGKPVTRYAGLPILTGYPPSKHDVFLPFTEVGYGGGSAVTTSIYIVSFREDGVVGIQTLPPEMMDIGNTDRGVHERDLFEWDCGISIEDYYSAIRLSSITDAAIAA